MSDEEFHEIQLNGKQLVFLFMAATVVSVVIFLCGVMVGRGVRAPRADLAAAATEAPVDPTAAIPSSSTSASFAAERPPVTTQETLTYAERLEAPVPPPETFKDTVVRVSEPPVSEPVAEAPAPRMEQRAVPPAAAIANASFAEPAGTGWVVQVGAYPRSTADVIAKALAGKGFPTFITPRDKGLFAVRVGKYNDRREAEAVARRLEQNEQFKEPWVIR
jgi:cell division protein FtsN